MTSGEDITATAATQLGVTELPAGSNRTPYGVWYGLDGYSWCAMFVSWCHYQTGYALPGDVESGAVDGDRHGFRDCTSALRYAQRTGQLVTNPVRGDIVLFRWSGTEGADHTGLVLDVADGHVTAIEGNTSSTTGGSQDNGGIVAQRTRPLSQVAGFWRPELRTIGGLAVASEQATTAPTAPTAGDDDMTPDQAAQLARIEEWLAPPPTGGARIYDVGDQVRRYLEPGYITGVANQPSAHLATAHLLAGVAADVAARAAVDALKVAGQDVDVENLAVLLAGKIATEIATKLAA